MDQSILAGVGNVYRCEVLFRHRVDPFRPGREIRPATFLAMWEDLVALLPVGVAFGQIITLDDQLAQARSFLADGLGDGSAPLDSALPLVAWQGAREGERGRAAARPPREGERGREGARPAYEMTSPLPREYAVYKRTGEPCLTCGSRIRSALVAGRTLYWCGRCQRRR